MPVSKASVSKVNGLEKFGNARIGAEHMADFSLSKARVAAGLHLKAFFLRRSVRGLLIDP
jgi:hypothetical protein